MNTISSLPKFPNISIYRNKAKNNFETATAWSIAKHNYNQNIYAILENNIDLWKSEKSPDISHFEPILSQKSMMESLIGRVLYECMEKNIHNLNFIKDSYISTNILPISNDKYPKLHALVSDLNLDYLSTCKGPIECLNILNEPNLLDTIKSSIKKRSLVKKYKVKILDPRNQTDLKIIKYVFKNINFSSLLAEPLSGRSAVDTLTHAITINDLQIYLKSGTRRKLNYVTNLDLMVIHRNLIFDNKLSTLQFLTGILLLLHVEQVDNENFIDDIYRQYKKIYPEEYRLTKTLLALGITDFDTVFNAIMNISIVTNESDMEMPLL